MSFLNPTVSFNPVSKWGEFKAGSGEFHFWDKSQDDGKERSIEKELVFLPLFIHTGVVGFSDELQSGIYSNEILSASDKLTVRAKGAIISEGSWADIKADVESKGGKYAKIVYGVRFFEGDKKERLHELVALKFSGASIGDWIAAKVRESERKALGLGRGEEQKKGSVKFFTMTVKKYKQDEGLIQIATPYAIELDAYFKGYFGQEASEEVNTSQMLESNSQPMQIADKSMLDIDAEFAEASEDQLLF
jgi:hypothetical protein